MLRNLGFIENITYPKSEQNILVIDFWGRSVLLFHTRRQACFLFIDNFIKINQIH